jgi:hypothetical protein
MFQNIDGHTVFVAVIPNNPQNLLPITDGGDRTLRPYAAALETAILTGIVREPGKYGIEIDPAADHFNIYAIQE